MKVLITGATSGMAFELAKNLIKKNHYVILTSHKQEQLKIIRNKLKEFSDDKYICQKLDITHQEDIEEALKIDFDCLISHAGIGIGGSILDVDISKLKENFEVNFFSSFSFVQQFANRQKRNKKPCKIILTSSLSSIVPIPFLGCYTSTKAAISMMAECLHLELKKINYPIKIKLIEPGAYYTGYNQIMINNKEEYMQKSLYFNNIVQKQIKNQNKLFSIIEKKSLKSIVKQMTKAVESNSSKLKYRAPLLQTLGAKLYLILLK